jgi:hypothetical protein
MVLASSVTSQIKREKTTIVHIGLRGTDRMRLETPAAGLRTVLRILFGEFSFFPTDSF